MKISTDSKKNNNNKIMYFQVDTMKLQIWLTLYFNNVRCSINVTCLFLFLNEKIKFFVSLTYF